MKLLHEAITISIEVDPKYLYWPSNGVTRAGEGSNRTFVNLSGAPWSNVDELLPFESELIARCVSTATNPDEFWDHLRNCEDEMLEEMWEFRPGLDVCVVSATLALNAAGCPTCISCSGHGRDVAFVDFWARAWAVPILCESAAAALVGLANNEEGTLAVYTDEADGLIRFARELRSRSAVFRSSRVPSPRKEPKARGATRTDPQLVLPLGISRPPRTPE